MDVALEKHQNKTLPDAGDQVDRKIRCSIAVDVQFVDLCSHLHYLIPYCESAVHFHLVVESLRESSRNNTYHMLRELGSYILRGTPPNN